MKEIPIAFYTDTRAVPRDTVEAQLDQRDGLYLENEGKANPRGELFLKRAIFERYCDFREQAGVELAKALVSSMKINGVVIPTEARTTDELRLAGDDNFRAVRKNPLLFPSGSEFAVIKWPYRPGKSLPAGSTAISFRERIVNMTARFFDALSASEEVLSYTLPAYWSHKYR